MLGTSKPIRYSIGFLLFLTTLTAASLALFRWFDWQARGLVFLISGWVALGYTGGWLSARVLAESRATFIQAALLVAINWMLWSLNQFALSSVTRPRHDLAEILQRMLEAQKNEFFVTLAVTFTALITIAAWRRNPRAMVHVGVACCLTWFIIVAIGYVVACASI